MPEPSSLALAVGDRVVYPNQGVCRVSAIDVKEVAGQKLTFVTMKREEDGAVVMVPQQKVQTIGVRKVASTADVSRIFDFLKSDSDRAVLDWKQRARTNLDRMSQGGLLGLAEVVKGLQVLSELRPLPNKERELYDNARHLLVTELAVSLGIPACDAEDSIDIVLFPPGRERPKRTVEEFQPLAGEEDVGLDLSDDLLNLAADLDLPGEEEPPSEESEEAESSEEPAEKASAPKKKKASAKSRESEAPSPAPAEGSKAKRAPKKSARPVKGTEPSLKKKTAPSKPKAAAKKKR